MSVTIPQPIPEGATHYHAPRACPEERSSVFYKQVDGEWLAFGLNSSVWRPARWAERNLPYCVLIEPVLENDVDNW